MALSRQPGGAEARALAAVCGLLAALFREEPSHELLVEMKAPAFAELLSDVGVDLGEVFADSAEGELAEDLAVEYARLFLGPGSHISPHESVHHHRDEGVAGLLWGSETVAVKRFIESVGIEYAPDYTGIPDHISVELEFLQKLALAEADALEKQHWALARDALVLQQAFVEEHLGRWAPEFCEKVIARARLPFYREAAALLRGLLGDLNQRIEEDLVRVDGLLAAGA